MKPVTLRSRNQGFSLIELMISLVIGLVVVGAVIVSLIGSGQTGRYQAAFAQMNEDAQIALSILSRDLQIAGYSQPTDLVNTAPPASTPTFNFASSTIGTSNPVFGCDTGFVDPAATSLACGTATTPAIEVVYEADKFTTVLTSGGVPSDCLGNAITVGLPAVYVARNRYYLAPSSSGRPELHCASANGATPQPLVENIEAMAIWYGVAVAANPTQVVRYVTATDIATSGLADEWKRVVSVRICLLVRSAEPVSAGDEATLTYLDCAGTSPPPTSSDGRLRRAYFTTAAIRDKMP